VLKNSIRPLRPIIQGAQDNDGRSSRPDPDLTVTLLAGGNALLEGVLDWKDHVIRTLSQAVDCSFNRIQFTSDLMPADMSHDDHHRDEDGRRGFRFERARYFLNLVLADEINRAAHARSPRC